jgi:chromosome segregation ATPase
MMISLTPSSTPADTHSVYTLINFLLDPGAVKGRADELVKLTQEHNAAAEKAQAAVQEAQRVLAEHDAKVSELTAHKTELDERATSLTSRENALAAREARLAQVTAATEAKHDAKAQELFRREENVRAVENALATGRVVLQQAKTEAENLRVTYETKLRKLREAAA